MNKLFYILGFLLPLPAYFNDNFAEVVQNMGGPVWRWFSSIGVVVYPVYLLIFILPLFLLISAIPSIFKLGLSRKTVFLKLLLGFISSSIIFLLLVLVAVSQFQFGF